MPIVKMARYRVRPESIERCARANREFVEYIKANEPGTLRYTAMQQVDDPSSSVNFMVFHDAAAETRHRESEGVKRFTAVLYPETVDGVQFTDYTTVAST